jgi:hypothetical protein
VTLSYAPGPLALDALAAALDAQLPAFNPTQLATVLQCLARMGFDPPPALAARLAAHAATLPGGAAKLDAALQRLGVMPAPRA